MYSYETICRRILTAAVPAAMMLACTTSCITDEGIPYPDIQANFTEFTVAHQDRPAVIDTVNRTVTVMLDEAANPAAVSVTSYKVGPTGAEPVDPGLLAAPLDLTSPMEITLKMWREYVWTISSRQTITRSFTIDGQVGSAVIDPLTHTVSAVVSAEVPLDAVTVTSVKLEGTTAVMEPDLSGKTVDFTSPVTVRVTEHGTTTSWTITVTQAEATVTLGAVDAWTGVIWASANSTENSDIAFEYRRAGTMQWTEAPRDQVSATGAVYTICINGVEPLTEYEVRAVRGDEYTRAMAVTTGDAPQLPDSHFTQWWKDGAVWNPWAEGGESFWDTGNRGAATLGQSNVVPIESPDGGYQGVMLQTKFVGISILGKLAAGSIFAGSYVRTDGTNGILSFGRPFTERPTRIRARIRYHSATIDYSSAEMSSLKGEPDSCCVWCALWDGAEPFEIRTNPKNRQLFDPADPSVVAYGTFDSGTDIEEWTDIIIPLEYMALDRRPTMIMLVASSSKYGDYFTGGNGSVLWLDSYELLYDY